MGIEKVEIEVLKLANTKNLALRFWADDLFDSLDKLPDKRLVLDFAGIEFMSRSFANEYLKLKRTSNKKITEKNLSDNLKEMLRLAASTKSRVQKYKETSQIASLL
jgi:hypothetical protein